MRGLQFLLSVAAAMLAMLAVWFLLVGTCSGVFGNGSL